MNGRKNISDDKSFFDLGAEKAIEVLLEENVGIFAFLVSHIFTHEFPITKSKYLAYI